MNTTLAKIIKRHPWRTSEIVKEAIKQGLLKIISPFRGPKYPYVYDITSKGLLAIEKQYSNTS